MFSLRTRLLLAVSVLALAAVVAVALAARQGTRLEFRRFLADEERHSASQGRSNQELAPILNGRCCNAEVMRAASARLQPNEALLVIDEQGKTIATGGAGAASVRNITTRLSGDVLMVDARRDREGIVEDISLRFIDRNAPAITLLDGSPATIYVVPIAQAGLSPKDAAFLGSVDRRLVIATFVVGLLTIGVTLALTRRIVRPIDELRAAARDVASGNLARRVAASGADEIAELGRSFNAMAAGLERAHHVRQQFLHDVAHELRTPLTALRCRLETIIDGLPVDPRQAVTGANEEVRHLSRLVDDLQELAMAEAREIRLTLAELSIADVARSAARAAGLEDDARLRLATDTSVRAYGDAIRVRQILVNLLTNADRHTPADGIITVRASSRDGETIVEVLNSGSSLSPEQLERVFDRFYRGDPARQRSTGGTGLGLAIVKHLVEAHGGRVWADCTADRVTFGVSLPRHEDVPPS
jgi:signal transduction histidine kinase